MRTSKYVGFLAIGLGILFIVAAAVLPVSSTSQPFDPFRIGVRGDNCGPAGYVAVRKAETECGLAARKRLLATSAMGLVVVAVGMALFAGGDEPHRSRIDVPTRRVRRRVPPRSPGSRRYKPG